MPYRSLTLSVSKQRDVVLLSSLMEFPSSAENVSVRSNSSTVLDCIFAKRRVLTVRHSNTGIQTAVWNALHLVLDGFDSFLYFLFRILLTVLLIELQSFLLPCFPSSSKFDFVQVVFLRCNNNDRDVASIFRHRLEKLLCCRLKGSRTVDVYAKPAVVLASLSSNTTPQSLPNIVPDYVQSV